MSLAVCSFFILHHIFPSLFHLHRAILHEHMWRSRVNMSLKFNVSIAGRKSSLSTTRVIVSSCLLQMLLSLIIGTSVVVDQVNGKFLSSLFNKGNPACATSAPFRMPMRLPSLSSLLCSQTHGNYMNSWPSSYPPYSAGGYSNGYGMYPSMGQ